MNGQICPRTFLGKSASGTVKHKIGFCSKCGWIHGTVNIVRVLEGNTTILRPYCKSCEQKFDKKIVCAYCGEKMGNQLFFTTFKRKKFTIEELEETCNIILPLCEQCRNNRSYKEILAKFPLSDMCYSCSDRFKCYTAGNE